jgi:hypothetical protein
MKTSGQLTVTDNVVLPGIPAHFLYFVWRIFISFLFPCLRRGAPSSYIQFVLLTTRPERPQRSARTVVSSFTVVCLLSPSKMLSVFKPTAYTACINTNVLLAIFSAFSALSSWNVGLRVFIYLSRPWCPEIHLWSHVLCWQAYLTRYYLAVDRMLTALDRTGDNIHCTCMYVCSRACMHVCICTYVYICMYVCVCMYVWCMYMYVCIGFAHTQYHFMSLSGKLLQSVFIYR